MGPENSIDPYLKILIKRDLSCAFALVSASFLSDLFFPFSQFLEEKRHRGERDSRAFVRPVADGKEVCPKSQRGGGTRETVGQAGPPFRLPDRG